ncbi:MAG: hypothetical protein HOQ36_19835 [Nocardia sp.]|nr:hypothetical protein [Nocardia sp.]NUS94626.1 hypothetical protein [Nocardia sp.]
MRLGADFRAIAARLARDFRLVAEHRRAEAFSDELHKATEELARRRTKIRWGTGDPLPTARLDTILRRGTDTTTRNGFIHFPTDESGVAYGERVLGPLRDGLDQDTFRAVFYYTEYSAPYNRLRHADPNSWFDELARARREFEALRELVGENPVPTVRRLVSISTRPDITVEQRELISRIVARVESRAPGEVYGGPDEIWRKDFLYQRAANNLGGPPDLQRAMQAMERMDRAFATPLPDSIHAQRGLHTIDHLVDTEGRRIAGRYATIDELRELVVGATQVDRGYGSYSLGATPARIPGRPPYPHVIEQDIPAGSQGLWMGERALIPDQRELILARDTEFRIHEVRGDLDEVVIDAQVVAK